MPRQRLFLIDSYGFIFRAYHARARTGAPPMRTAAGLSTEVVFIFSNMLKRIITTRKPDYLVAVFEGEGKTHRESEFAEYKANRTETPQDLIDQIPYVARFLEAMRIPVLSAPGFEADDVIGALSEKAVHAGLDVTIVSSDKDLLQLVNDRVFMLNPMKDDTLYDPAKAEDFMGVPPSRIPDLLALKGDSVDNIPGAPGIGDKGAKDLIVEYGSVENLLDHAADVKKKTYRESLLNHRDQILLSKKLATIDTNAPIDLHLEQFRLESPNEDALRDLYRELEFFSQLKDLGPAADKRTRDYALVTDSRNLLAYVASFSAEAVVGFVVQPMGEGLLVEDFFGLSSSEATGRSAPWSLIQDLKPWLEDPTRKKATFDLKPLILKLEAEGIHPQGFDHDVLLYSFLLHPENAAGDLAAVSERLLDRRFEPDAAIAADAVRELAERLAPQLEADGLTPVYRDIDRPLIPVLAHLEQTGIRVDRPQLAVLSSKMDLELSRLTAEIHAISGKPFNINSPQQLGRVLFEDLAIPAPFKVGKGKQISTAADILESLAEEHPIAQLVLDYRQISKLKGTYVDALPALLDAASRVHTTLSMVVAATGRLSSSNPNLQNIPIRSELGREIRAAFVPRPGWQLIAADYSQIELRLLAHMSLDEVLVDAFRKHQDIHARTAAEVFGVDPQSVNPDMRRYAKTVNFGIIYGQTPFGLAKQLNISRPDAERFIQKYFETYQGVRSFIDDTVEKARQTGFTQTLFGRRRAVVDIKSRNPNARYFAERVAVNTPLQGTAADLIKIAMIRLDHAMRDQKLAGQMLLQVHDELLFEAPPDEAPTLAALAKEIMENVYELAVPLTVEAGIGPNWRDAK